MQNSFQVILHRDISGLVFQCIKNSFIQTFEIQFFDSVPQTNMKQIYYALRNMWNGTYTQFNTSTHPIYIYTEDPVYMKGWSIIENKLLMISPASTHVDVIPIKPFRDTYKIVRWFFKSEDGSIPLEIT